MKLRDINRGLLRYHAQKAKKHTITAARTVHKHALSMPKKIAISSVGFALVAIIAAQLLYPTNSMVWFVSVDGIAVGGMDKEEVTRKLDGLYASAVAPVYYKDDTSTPKATPTLPDIGITVKNAERVASIDYPWYWRIVPTSGLWYNALLDAGEPSVERNTETLDTYMDKTFGAECILTPTNATIALKGDTFEVVKSTKGGTCNYDALHESLAAVVPVLKPEKLVVEGATIKPAVNDEVAEKVRAVVAEKTGKGIVISVNGKDETIPGPNVRKWLTFTAEGSTLTYTLSADGITWLNETYGKALAITPGVTSITTSDYVETARTNGAPGRVIDAQASANEIVKYIKGGVAKAEAKTRAVPPTIKYIRSYSATDAGMSALMEHFAQSHPGTYGISLVELSGVRRHASYNGTKQFTTASTYKLFVAYSTLLRIESGQWNWNDQIAGGRNLTKCFDDMIVRSDNACAETLLRKISFTPITNEAKAIGATRTSFLGSSGIKSTAEDESLFLSLLYSGQILSQQSSRDTLINALKRNIYRQGVPAGMPGVTVANKVGFLDGLFHDAAIVYSPTGTYVLTVLTDGSSWANIAELTRQLEALRNS
jgi:beta-lactamase class A